MRVGCSVITLLLHISSLVWHHHAVTACGIFHLGECRCSAMACVSNRSFHYICEAVCCCGQQMVCVCICVCVVCVVCVCCVCCVLCVCVCCVCCVRVCVLLVCVVMTFWSCSSTTSTSYVLHRYVYEQWTTVQVLFCRLSHALIRFTSANAVQ